MARFWSLTSALCRLTAIVVTATLVCSACAGSPHSPTTDRVETAAPPAAALVAAVSTGVTTTTPIAWAELVDPTPPQSCGYLSIDDVGALLDADAHTVTVEVRGTTQNRSCNWETAHGRYLNIQAREAYDDPGTYLAKHSDAEDVSAQVGVPAFRNSTTVAFVTRGANSYGTERWDAIDVSGSADTTAVAAMIVARAEPPTSS